MIKSEEQLVDKFKKDFLKLNPMGFWKKLHGNVFQRDLPDVLATCRDGACLAEFKFESGRRTLPIRDVLMSKLTEGQATSMAEIDAARGPIKPIVLLGFYIPSVDGCAVISVQFTNAMKIMYSIRKLEESILNKHYGHLTSFIDGSRVQTILSYGESFQTNFLFFY